MHTIYEQHCFDGYDSLFAAGPHHIEEFRMLTNYNHLPERTTYAIGYGKFDLMKPCSEQVPLEERKPEVLIAPSWGENNLIATCGRKLVQILVDQGLDVTLRPHPSFFVEEDKSLAELISDFSTHPNVSIERSTGTSTAMWTADALISDYSGFALEYAALRRRPVVFVDVPRKLLNPAWEDLALPAVEIDHRDQLGEIVPCQPETISEAVKAQLSAEDVGDKAISQYLFDMPSVGATAAATLKQDFPEVYG